MHRFIRHLGIVVPSVLLLAACGGGGGGGGAAGGGGGGGGGGSSDLGLSRMQLHGDLASANALAGARVHFDSGSITQSSNTDSQSKTTDAIDTGFQEGVLTVEVVSAEGDILSLNSRDDTRRRFPEGAAWLSDLQPHGTNAKEGWILAKEEEGTATVAMVYAYWNDEGPTNYLAGGYWVSSSDTGEIEQGVFTGFGAGSIFAHGADGWTRPTGGTATFTGEAEGSYLHTDEGGGIWWSDGLSLTADFTDNAIEGCIGCIGSIYTYDVDDLANGEAYEGNIALGPATIEEDGTFQGSLTLNHPNVVDGSSSGSWGGMFSDNDNEDTMPQAVGGTLGGPFAESDDGGRGTFTGVFYGERP